jgi:hypothetical protein
MASPSAFEILLSKIPRHFRARSQKYLGGFLQAIAEGDEYISSQVEAVHDNIFSVTAVGKHLNAVGARYGVTSTIGKGIGDDYFRKMIPLMGMSPKQIQSTLQQLIDVFYGPYATHANLTTEAAEPYRISAGGDLRLRVDIATDYTIIFGTGDAVDLTAMTAQELANAITTKTDGKVIGSVVTDVLSGKKYLNIRTRTIGNQGFMQVLGGDVQSSLRFPAIRDTQQGTATWSVARYGTADEMEYTLTGGTDPQLGAAEVQIGDRVCIRVDSGFNLKNCGTFEVTAVGVSSFRVKNEQGVPQSVTTAHADDVTFFRAGSSNILQYQRFATSLEVSPDELTVVLPVSSPIVIRELKGAHHVQGATSRANAGTSNSLTLDSVTNFPAAGAIRKMSSRTRAESNISSVAATTITLADAAAFPAAGAIYSNVTRSFFYYSGKSGNTLQNVTPTPPSSLVATRARYTERYKYTSITGNTLNGVFPDPSALVGWEIAAAGAVLDGDQPGSFVFSPETGYTVTSKATTLSQGVVEGDIKTVLQVDDCSEFPESGYVVLEEFTTNEEGPIPFRAKIGEKAMILSPIAAFSKNHPQGAQVRFVSSITGYKPATDGSDYPVYVTSTSPARDLIESFIAAIIAAGFKVNFIVIVPEQKWPVLTQLYASDPVATEL